MVTYKLYNPNISGYERSAKTIDNARKGAIAILKKDASVQYVVVHMFKESNPYPNPLGFITRYYPNGDKGDFRTIGYDWVTDNPDSKAKYRIIHDINKDGSLGSRRL